MYAMSSKLTPSHTPKPRVLFVLPARARGGAEIRLLGMLERFERIEPLLLAHGSLPGVSECQVACDDLDRFAACRDPYPYDPGTIRNYGEAVARVAARVQPDITFGWMHNGSFCVADARTRHALRGYAVGSVLGPPSAHFRLHGRAATWYERRLFRGVCWRLDRLVTNSSGVRADLVRHFGAPPARVRAIHNGIDLERVRALARVRDVNSPPPKQGPRLVASGRLSLEKGFDLLIRAFAEVRRLIAADPGCLPGPGHGPGPGAGPELVLIGDGPERQRLERLIGEQELGESVRLTGYLDNPFPWLASADLFVSASRLEGFGNALVEAMALGVPVVATDCASGPREIIASTSDGLLVAQDDVNAMSEAILILLKDADRRARLAEGARQRAEAFSSALMITGYEALLLELTASAAASRA